ncbi:WYL domain-containing protein [Kribbella sandramycini]|uniref:Putative DNA-binding transcriptional regulator YafY n=1 Tax=Kribbella sandramycini TaxID=60450 RepID=A0A7Y4KVW6_9ACTN|nr:WYL domain-containing protein [Kribbella sandramycini]MBB6567870.1 putative DNA-binding transcriptional regulator YafY [Kribbella sandramycini]NOL39535.1 WYL domain-containing protein [Kribbella sandramycini]
MRADRLLQIILLLQRRGRISAGELAERLEVSRRTVVRDMEALSAAGVPVYAERGRNGGCVLLPGYRADVSGLTAREAQALFAWSGRSAMSDELGLQGPLKSAMGKLAATLPTELQSDAEALSGSIVVDRRRWFADAEDNGALPVLRQAVVTQRRVRLRYASASQGLQRRTVDPWGLVEQAGRWYLVAAHRGTARMYRVSRVQQADVLEESAARPDGLDVRAEWDRLRSSLEQQAPEGVRVEVRVRPERAELFRRIATPMLAKGTLIEEVPSDDEWPQLRLEFRVREAACGVLLAFGADAEVLEPIDLRARLLELAKQTVALYS